MKTALDAVGGFEERDRYAMDFRHWIKLTGCSQVRIVDQVLANFRLDEGSISFSSYQKQWKETLSISKEYWGSPLHLSYYEFLGSYWTHRTCIAMHRLKASGRRRLVKLLRQSGLRRGASSLL